MGTLVTRERHFHMPTVESCALQVWLVLIRETFGPLKDGLRFQRECIMVRVNMIFNRPIQEALRHSFTADYVTNMQMQTCLAK